MVFPIAGLLTHAGWIKIFETCFFVNVSSYVFKCQWHILQREGPIL